MGVTQKAMRGFGWREPSERVKGAVELDLVHEECGQVVATVGPGGSMDALVAVCERHTCPPVRHWTVELSMTTNARTAEDAARDLLVAFTSGDPGSVNVTPSDTPSESVEIDLSRL